MASAASECNESLSVCEMGACGGLVFPLFGDSEQSSSQGVRALMYLFGLFYSFMGVNVVSDYFLTAIETITSQKLRVRNAEGRFETRERWNSTVANLTLLALGSSAPEILLSCIEMLKDEGYSGKLGPSTIVGSAAFNLFVIIGVCVVSIRCPTDFRAIEGLGVYHVTMLFSLFAYFWLWFIVVVSSAEVVDVWEAAVALVMFPVLVLISWLTDKGYLSFLTLDPLPRSEEEEHFVHDLTKHPRVRASQLHRCVSKDLRASLRKTERRLNSTEEVEPEQLNRQQLPFKDNGRGILDEMGKVIANDHGIIAFRDDCYETKARADQRHNFTIDVLRRNGTKGTVVCQYDTAGLSAVQSRDYVQTHGILEWKDGDEEVKQITIPILGKRVGEPADSFQLVLSDIKTNGSADTLAHFNPHDDGGKEKAICTVTVLNDNQYRPVGLFEQCGALSEKCIDWDNIKIGFEVWAQQVKLAFSMSDEEKGDDHDTADEREDKESDSAPGILDYLTHALTLPWKLLFAMLCPPSNWGGGWLLFSMALFYIALCTAIIMDLASFFGCCAGIPEEVTAVTVVALGTSLPDMFASVTSAREDETADASIVNVTGSNSVNVFLGIGLPWTVAALSWQQWGATNDWQMKYKGMVNKYPKGAFVVKAGSLGFTVLLFFFLAAICIVTLRIRRIRCHGELGGPTAFKYMSGLFLLCLWITYVGCTIWKSSAGKHTDGWAALLPVMCGTLIAFMVGILVEIWSYRNPQAAREALLAARVCQKASKTPAQDCPYEELEESAPASPERRAERNSQTVEIPVEINIEDLVLSPREHDRLAPTVSVTGGVDAAEDSVGRRGSSGPSGSSEHAGRAKTKEDKSRKKKQHRGNADCHVEVPADLETQGDQQSPGRAHNRHAREVAKSSAQKEIAANAVSPVQYGRSSHQGECVEQARKPAVTILSDDEEDEPAPPRQEKKEKRHRKVKKEKKEKRDRE